MAALLAFSTAIPEALEGLLQECANIQLICRIFFRLIFFGVVLVVAFIVRLPKSAGSSTCHRLLLRSIFSEPVVVRELFLILMIGLMRFISLLGITSRASPWPSLMSSARTYSAIPAAEACDP